jgi:putative Holliday junction resolvase
VNDDQNIIALDIGEKRIGVARANKYARMPSPLVTLANDQYFNEKLNELLMQNSASELVVGLPRGLDGQETMQTKFVRDFVAQLDINIPVHFQDEALTSVHAREILDQKKREYKKEQIDALAASIILMDYLEANYV